MKVELVRQKLFYSLRDRTVKGKIMAFKNILIIYNGSESSDAALEFALILREKYDAHVTGLLAYNFAPVNDNVRSWMPEDVQASIKTAQKEAIQNIEDKFQSAIANCSSPEKIHWISSSGEGDKTVAKYARFYDLTILGRYDAVHGEDQQELHPDMIAMVSGRPVLLVPRVFEMSAFNDRVTLAWDGKRASSRAVNDAIDILRTDAVVTVLTVGDAIASASLPEIDVRTSLQRHGIKTQIVEMQRDGKSIAYRVLEFLEQSDSSLLVMGAYEHSKFRQSMIGGVTNSVLKKAKVPILISH